MELLQASAAKVAEVEGKTLDLATSIWALVAPPPKLTVSEWADERRMLPRSAAEPGRWRTSRTPYLRAVMDACADPTVKKVVLMFASQTGKTECLLNIAGYFVDYDPAAMLMVQPTVEMAESFSKERLAPMLTDTPTLATKVADPRSRDSNNTILRKEYPGGFVVLIGANAPAGLASRPIRVVLADEVDRYPVSAGTEGDPLSLAEKRQTTFWNSLTIVTSTPTVKGESRIEAEYTNSTREEWCVPCPSCGEMQPYEWGRLIFPSEGDAPSPQPPLRQSSGCTPPGEGVDIARPADAPEMVCRACGCLHGEWEWKAGEGQWVARAESEVRGFHLNALASPWLSWGELVKEFLDAKRKGPEVLKTFINTRLAECWEEAGETLDEELLSARRHYYNCDVPDSVNWLTCGVDVQKDRLELEVVGWGPGKESWGIEYLMIPGDPQQAAVWNQLDMLLQSTYKRADGRVLPISCTAIDSGYATSSVYAFTKLRAVRYVFAVKGMGGPGLPVVGAWRRQGKNKDVAVFPVGTDASKDLILTRLTVNDEGPGYCHFPREDTSSGGRLRGYGGEYFRGLMAERRVERKSMGRIYHTWVKKTGGARNEPLDCRVYATAALEILQPDLDRVRTVTPGAATKPAKPKGRRTLNKGVS